jgi:tetratricopeptide (TPR) repeat protein
MTLKSILVLCVIWIGCSTAVAGQAPPNLRELGQREYQAGHYGEAESYFRAALEQEALDEDTRAGILSDLGTLLLDEERSVEAEEAYMKALALRKQRTDKRVTASLLRHLGAAYSIQRRDEEAISILNKALKMAKAPPENPELTGAILNSLGVAYFRQLRFKKAEQFFKQGLQALANVAVGPFEIYMAPLFNNLGAVYCLRRNFPLAEQFLTKALTLTTDKFGSTHAALIDSLDGLGYVYTKMGRYADAEAQYRRAIGILGLHNPIPFDVRVARSHKGLADTYMEQGKLDEALRSLEEAVAIARPNLTKSQEMISILEAYSSLLAVKGNASEAKELRSEARRARITMESTVRAYKRD